MKYSVVPTWTCHTSTLNVLFTDNTTILPESLCIYLNKGSNFQNNCYENGIILALSVVKIYSAFPMLITSFCLLRLSLANDIHCLRDY